MIIRQRGKYYHPSNAKFWFYGDDPADARLELVDKYLSEFEKIEVRFWDEEDSSIYIYMCIRASTSEETTVVLQKAWISPASAFADSWMTWSR